MKPVSNKRKKESTMKFKSTVLLNKAVVIQKTVGLR